MTVTSQSGMVTVLAGFSVARVVARSWTLTVTLSLTLI